MDRAGRTRIELCGTFSVELEGTRLDEALPGRQGRLLFAFLVLNRDRPISRDRLIDLLWPSRPPADPDESLSALLSKVRRAVGANTLRGRTELTLVLSSDAWVDLEAARAAAELAESALARADPERAWPEAHAALEVASRGFFARHDNPWAQERSEEVEQLRLRALECVAAAGVALGGAESVAAERAAQEVITLAPLREPMYRLLMELLAARGDAAGALGHYEQLRVRLRDELGIAPSAAVRALHARLISEGPASEWSGTQDRSVDERKVVTVLLADVVPDADPERTEAWLEEVRTVAAAEAPAGGGLLDIGTVGGVLVTFGLPAAREDHVERAVHLGRTLSETLRETAPIRIAIETGEVVVGRSGPTGLPVQAAARMLQDARPGEVLVGERAAAAARAREEPASPVSRFVGRDVEVGLFMSAATRAVEGRSPHLVSIVGEAGVGKSRLVRELRTRLLAELPEVRWLLGRCLSYGRGLAYRALAEVLTVIRGGPEAGLAAREILGLTLGLDVAGDLHPLAAVEQLRAAWVELVGGLVSDRPTALVIEDLHWAQPDLLDLLEQLVSEVTGPLLLVCTARPELLDVRPGWGRRRDATTLWLEPLAPSEAARLVEGSSSAVQEVVLERAEGNPFFLEELLACVGDEGHFEAAAIPDSIQAVLAARIDQLPPLERETLQAASVIGRNFWREAVEALLDGGPASFALLEERDFVRPRPRSSLEGARELAFKHALTCEVAYGTLRRARRARLHGRFAEWLEDFAGGRDEHAALLAHHYYEAARADVSELRERAVRWLRRSAELATARYEIEEGLVLLHRALELETQDAGRCWLYRAIARANALKFDGEAFWSTMETAAELAPDAATRAEIISQLAVESFVRAGMWTRTPAIEQIGDWVARALELARPGTASRARALIAKASLDLDDREAAAEAAAIAERLDDAELCVHAWDACGAAAMVAADYEAAWRWRTRRLELLARITDPDLRTIIAETPYASCIATARFEQAREIARLHDELTRPLTPHHRMHGAAILVEVEELLGGWDEIRAQEARVRDAVAANAATPCLRNARSLLVCALAAASLGDDRRANELERAAAALGLLGRQVLDAPRLRLALLRNDRTRAEELLAGLLDESGWYARGHGTSLATLTTRLEALAVLGHTDRVEAEAPRLLQPGTYLEPFALRAIGIVRSDHTLIQQAADRFERLALLWHAAQCRALA